MGQKANGLNPGRDTAAGLPDARVEISPIFPDGETGLFIWSEKGNKMRQLNTKTKCKMAIIAWETEEARFINMLLSPSHILKMKIDKVAAKKQEGGKQGV